MQPDMTASPGPNASVTLREVTRETLRSVLKLAVKPGQERFVADNATSIAEAYFAPTAWFRAIYADDTPVGFAMLDYDPALDEYDLWRFMVDGAHQGKGFGYRALQQIIEDLKRRPNARMLALSYVPGDGSPRDFYRKLGFEETGDSNGGELVMRLRLADESGRV